MRTVPPVMRVLTAIAGTIVGLVALLSFKTHPAHSSAAGLPSASLPATAGSSTSPSSAPSSTAPSSSAAGPNPGTGSATRSATSTAPASTAPASARTISGQSVQTRYGTVQVQVTVSGKQITNVQFLQLTADDPRSQEINSAAGPILLQETLSAQSSQIDTVSGATYTSEGYLQSLQSALDQAGI
jgi:uncharacterized protein with FMN-binding domain